MGQSLAHNRLFLVNLLYSDWNGRVCGMDIKESWVAWPLLFDGSSFCAECMSVKVCVQECAHTQSKVMILVNAVNATNATNATHATKPNMPFPYESVPFMGMCLPSIATLDRWRSEHKLAKNAPLSLPPIVDGTLQLAWSWHWMLVMVLIAIIGSIVAVPLMERISWRILCVMHLTVAACLVASGVTACVLGVRTNRITWTVAGVICIVVALALLTFTLHQRHTLQRLIRLSRAVSTMIRQCPQALVFMVLACVLSTCITLLWCACVILYTLSYGYTQKSEMPWSLAQCDTCEWRGHSQYTMWKFDTQYSLQLVWISTYSVWAVYTCWNLGRMWIAKVMYEWFMGRCHCHPPTVWKCVCILGSLVCHNMGSVFLGSLLLTFGSPLQQLLLRRRRQRCHTRFACLLDWMCLKMSVHAFTWIAHRPEDGWIRACTAIQEVESRACSNPEYEAVWRGIEYIGWTLHLPIKLAIVLITTFVFLIIAVTTTRSFVDDAQAFSSSFSYSSSFLTSLAPWAFPCLFIACVIWLLVTALLYMHEAVFSAILGCYLLYKQNALPPSKTTHTSLIVLFLDGTVQTNQ